MPLMKMKRINNICYNCGKDGADTKDHIPPRSIFPKKPSGQLITVKAHRSCNESFQNDDELFRNLVIAASHRTYEGKLAWEEQVLRSFNKNPGAKKILNNLLIPIKINDPVSGKTIIQYALALDSQMLERQITRWTKGLYYKRFNEPLNDDAKIEIVKLQPPEISVTSLMERLAKQQLRPLWNHVEKNIFSYTFITSNEAQDIGFIIYVFFNTEVFMASINVNDKSSSKFLKKA